jgi:hypothetical protein
MILFCDPVANLTNDAVRQERVVEEPWNRSANSELGQSLSTDEVVLTLAMLQLGTRHITE